MRLVLKESFLEHQKSIKLLAKIGVGVLALVFLLLPGFLRASELAIGDKPYYHLSMAGELSGMGPGWNFLLGYVPMNYLLLALGLVSVFLLFNFKELKFEQKLASVAFFIVSPSFIYLFNVGERFGIAFMFSVLSGLFLLRKNYSFSIVSLLLIFLFDINVGLFILFLTLLYFFHIKNFKKFFYIFMIAFLLFVLPYKGLGLGIISDFGATIGSSIFALLFSAFCFLLFWNKKKFLYLYGIGLLLFLFSLRMDFGIFYFNLFLAVLMSICFFELLYMKWESKLIRDLILLIVVCGLLFSGLSYANRLSNEKPHEYIFDILDKLPEGSKVFSDVEYGNWILYKGKENVWNSFMGEEELILLEEEFSILLESREYAGSAEILKKHRVDFILIDEDLNQEWQESGLVYLLRYNTEDFKLIHDLDKVGVWRFF